MTKRTYFAVTPRHPALYREKVVLERQPDHSPTASPARHIGTVTLSLSKGGDPQVRVIAAREIPGLLSGARPNPPAQSVPTSQCSRGARGRTPHTKKSVTSDEKSDITPVFDPMKIATPPLRLRDGSACRSSRTSPPVPSVRRASRSRQSGLRRARRSCPPVRGCRGGA